MISCRKLKFSIVFAVSWLLSAPAFSRESIPGIEYCHGVLWMLNSHGILRSLTFNADGSFRDKRHCNFVAALTKDPAGTIIIASDGHSIVRYNGETSQEIGRYHGKLYGLVADSKGHCYAITRKGIEDISTGRAYLDTNIGNDQVRLPSFLSEPSCFYIDRNDNIWMGFDFGEWGGGITTFNTRTKKYLPPAKGLASARDLPAHSFFEDNDHLYLSAGLQHMMNMGEIFRLDTNMATLVFRSRSARGLRIGRIDVPDVPGEYIGPAAWNPSGSCFYFYSQHGIFRGATAADLSSLANWRLVFKPELTWKYGLPYAVGSALPVLKLIAADKDRLFFLSRYNGVGYWDGSKLTMIE